MSQTSGNIAAFSFVNEAGSIPKIYDLSTIYCDITKKIYKY